MAWDKTLPADASKLRLSAGYIRANWTALENGDVPYVKLKLAEQAANPTRANDTGWLFTKQASSQTELYYEDDRNPALVTQISNNGGIGATSQILYGSAVITSGSYQNTQNAFISAWGSVDSSGNLTAGFGVTSARNSTGLYTITFTSALSGANNYGVCATAYEDPGPNHNRVAMCTVRNAANFRIRTQRTDQSGGSFEDCAFMFVVFGGR
jgi:hypothetical protein